MEILGPLEADAEEIEKTRHVFGDENAEEYYSAATLEPAQEAVDDCAHEKAVLHEHSVEMVRELTHLGIHSFRS